MEPINPIAVAAGAAVAQIVTLIVALGIIDSELAKLVVATTGSFINLSVVLFAAVHNRAVGVVHAAHASRDRAPHALRQRHLGKTEVGR